MNEIRHIIWDWNGTLLDDAELCVQCINEILKSRNLKMVNIEFYRDHFSFPVSNYYKKLGLPVSGDEYQEVAKSFIENYKNKSRNLNLQPNCIEVLTHFQKEGIEQSVLSASHHQDLTKYIGQFELNSFMSLISGVDNFHAKGKVGLSKEHFSKINCTKDQILMVGDTMLDDEIVRELSINGALVTNGHNSDYALRNSHSVRVANLKVLMNLLHC